MANKSCHYCGAPLPGDAGFCVHCGVDGENLPAGPVMQGDLRDSRTGELIAAAEGQGFFASLTTRGKIGLAVAAAIVIAAIVIVVLAVM